MVKVCHLTSVHSATDERIFYKECVSLANAGYEVFIVAPNTKNYTNLGVNIIGVEPKRDGRLYRMFFLTKEVFRKGLEIDAEVYHLHDPELLPIGLKLIKKGKRVIFDSHEDVAAQISTKTWIPKPVRLFLSYMFLRYEKKVLSQFDAVVSVTPSIVERLARLNSNTYQITNYPVIKKDIEPLPNRKWGRSFCFAGGISEQWLHHNILQALDGIEGVKYKLVGLGEGDYMDTLKKMKSWDKVDYQGKIPHSQVIDFIAESTVGMALNEYSPNVGGKLGSLGNTKLFEYMKAGIPVICTDFILWRQLVEKWECGICVNPYNVEEISLAIQYLFQNLDKAKQMGENGRLAYEQEYNWGTQEPILFKLYKDVLCK
jgi:glycosyltransferase involved in cell wall biosynthesis